MRDLTRDPHAVFRPQIAPEPGLEDLVKHEHEVVLIRKRRSESQEVADLRQLHWGSEV
jgi:hypothetical protein